MPTLLTPKMLGLHAFAVVAITAMVVLGMWQLGAYGERQQVSAQQQADRPPVPIDDVLGPDDAFTAEADARTVTVTGSYGEQQFLVDGDDAQTPWLVTPLRTATGSSVLVVRGYAGQPAPPPAGAVTVSGSLLPSQPREDDPAPGDGVEPSVAIARLVADVDTDLYSGFVVLEDQRPPADLATVTPPTPDPSFTAGIRNLMYALQWWAFAAFGVFMWWRIARDEIRARPAGNAQVA
ncbi:MAG TPA: SURF1 family protein [Nocardioidaceae bacterium]|nr:SURF1 family protein [Nocardioidaceae bacterium]